MPQKIDTEKTQAALEYLAEYLQSGSREPIERAAAATALGTAGGQVALDALLQFLRCHGNAPPQVRAAALLAVGQVASSANNVEVTESAL